MFCASLSFTSLLYASLRFASLRMGGHAIGSIRKYAVARGHAIGTIRKYAVARGHAIGTIRKYAVARGHAIGTIRKYAVARGHTIGTIRKYAVRQGKPHGEEEVNPQLLFFLIGVKKFLTHTPRSGHGKHTSRAPPPSAQRMQSEVRFPLALPHNWGPDATHERAVEGKRNAAY